MDPGARAIEPTNRYERMADMRTLRLDRFFDAVLVHDCVCYLTAEADLRRAMETSFSGRSRSR
jgi:hypothetical protein